jgi:hypothetical protein
MGFARHLHQRPANSHDELSPVLLTGQNGKRASVSSLTSLLNRVCSLTLSPLLPMPLSSIECGHTTSRPTKPKRKRPVASVAVLLVVAKFVLLTTLTHPAWNRPACAFSSLLAPSRRSASTVPMSVMPSQKILPLRRPSNAGQPCLSTLVDHTPRTPAIPYGHVLPLQRALQGHPESPRLWERHVNTILDDPTALRA